MAARKSRKAEQVTSMFELGTDSVFASDPIVISDAKPMHADAWDVPNVRFARVPFHERTTDCGGCGHTDPHEPRTDNLSSGKCPHCGCLSGWPRNR